MNVSNRAGPDSAARVTVGRITAPASKAKIPLRSRSKRCILDMSQHSQPQIDREFQRLPRLAGSRTTIRQEISPTRKDTVSSSLRSLTPSCQQKSEETEAR